MEYLCKYKVYRVDVLQELHCDSGYDVSDCHHSNIPLPSLNKKKMLYLLLQSHFLVLVVCNVRIRFHPLSEQQEQITLLEEGKL